MRNPTIDLTSGTRTFEVPTAVIREGTSYMGPTVKVTARDAAHAKDLTKQAGYSPNRYFGPTEVRK
jgi:hypothetical protein